MAERTQPIYFEWDGDHMVPRRRFKALCDKTFVVGEVYALVEDTPPSDASRRHYFATLRDMWGTLPESEAGRFPSAEHLRKWALCKAGYAKERIITCDTEKDAKEMAALVRPLDPFALIVRTGTVVRVYQAESQSKRNMKNERFQQSKEAVFRVVAELVGVPAREVRNHRESA